MYTRICSMSGQAKTMSYSVILTVNILSQERPTCMAGRKYIANTQDCCYNAKVTIDNALTKKHTCSLICMIARTI